MLQIRYNKITGTVTGWWTDRPGNTEGKLKNRPQEVLVDLDMEAPKISLDTDNFTYDTNQKTLVHKPSEE